LSDRSDDGNRSGNATDYLANERTYLSWLRTGIATIGLGFVIAKFGLAIRELTGISSLPESDVHLSSLIGVILTVLGGAMILLAFRRFSSNQQRIRAGNYEPTKGVELVLTATLFVVALMLVAYLLLTF
jgi:putative membrane protein